MSAEPETARMVTYQFEIDDDTWEQWKNTVPRSKSLDTRIIELIEADAQGNVQVDETPATTDTEASVGAAKSETTTRTHGRDDLREQLCEELSGSGDLLEARVDEVLAMYDELRDRGEAEKDDLLDVINVDATNYKDRDSVWANMIKGRDTLRALPGVETPPTGRTIWRYTRE